MTGIDDQLFDAAKKATPARSKARLMGIRRSCSFVLHRTNGRSSTSPRKTVTSPASICCSRAEGEPPLDPHDPHHTARRIEHGHGGARHCGRNGEQCQNDNGGSERERAPHC